MHRGSLPVDAAGRHLRARPATERGELREHLVDGVLVDGLREVEVEADLPRPPLVVLPGPHPVRAASTMSAVTGSARRRRATSYPTIPGRPMSRNATSGAKALGAARASGPVWLSAVTDPPCISTRFLTSDKPVPRPPWALSSVSRTWLNMFHAVGGASREMRPCVEAPGRSPPQTAPHPSFSCVSWQGVGAGCATRGSR